MIRFTKKTASTPALTEVEESPFRKIQEAAAAIRKKVPAETIRPVPPAATDDVS